MTIDPLRPPDLTVITGAFLAAEAKFVVIGGFAVVANRHVRATRDVDLLIPDDRENDAACLAALASLAAVRERDGERVTVAMLDGSAHLRVSTRAGTVDLLREGEAPLDFATVQARALRADLGAGAFHVAGLESLVGFKRLADRPQDRADLAELEAIHGELPIEPIPGLDPSPDA
jgi:hypothetical protein